MRDRRHSKKRIALYAVAGLAVADGVGIYLAHQYLSSPWTAGPAARETGIAAAPDALPAHAPIRVEELRAPPSMVLATLPPVALAKFVAPAAVPEVAALAPVAVERDLPGYIPTSTLASRRNAMTRKLVSLDARRAPSHGFSSAFAEPAAVATGTVAADAPAASLAGAATIEPAPATGSDILDLQIAETTGMARTIEELSASPPATAQETVPELAPVRPETELQAGPGAAAELPGG